MSKNQKIIFSLLVVPALILSGIQVTHAQKKLEKKSEKENKFALKAYVNTRLHIGINRNFQAGPVSAAISKIKSNGNFQELELSGIAVSSEFSPATPTALVIPPMPAIGPGARIQKQSLSMRYEYSVCLRGKPGTFVPFLGLSAGPYASGINVSHTVSTEFPSNSQRYGMIFSFIPRLQWNVKGNWFLDLNVPLNLLEGSYTRFVMHNPAFTQSQRTTYMLDLRSVADMSFRIGAGLRL